MKSPDGVTVDTLARVAPVMRGLLSNPTHNDDMPYRHLILKSVTSQEAIDFAASAESLGPYPAAIKHLTTLPLYLDVGGNYDSALAVREKLAQKMEGYVTQHGEKPQVICLRGMGILYVAQDSSAADESLHNKVALVTGAAGAIGHGICKALLDKGCYVATTDLPGERLDQLVQEFAAISKDRILGVPLDVTNEASVAQGFAAVIEMWGGIDIVVVNAGIALVASLTEMSLADFQRVERVNVEGSFLTISEAGKVLAPQGTGGDIVLVSTKSVFSPAAKYAAYSATKAASHQLGRVASLELAEFGVRVNMVAPVAVFSDGKYNSQLWAEIGADRMKALGQDEADLETYYRDRNLLKAKITARHVANAVLFFVTHQTPTTGATIPIDGGLPDATPR